MPKQASTVENRVPTFDPTGAAEVAAANPTPPAPRCPKCRADKVDVAYGPYRIRERAAIIAFRFPVECAACGHRFALSVLRGDLDLVLRRKHVVLVLIVLLLLLWGVFLAGFTLATARQI